MKTEFITLLFLFVLFISTKNYCQQYSYDFQDGIIWVIIDDENNKPFIDGKIFTKNQNLNNVLNAYEVTKFSKVFPYSKNDYLLSVYEIIFNGLTVDFIDELDSAFTEIIKVPVEEQIAVYEPSDYMWWLTTQDPTGWLWHLKKIQTDYAWNITKGESSIKIAILDTWFDINHPDLANKLYTNYDPFSNTPFSSSCYKNHHGTAVASFAGAHTDGGGQLSSIGFNCMIIPYQAWAGNYLQRAHYASLAMGAKVLTSSAGGWSCRCSTIVNNIEREAVQEILNNGTVIVMPAGNGPTGSHCRPQNYTIDQPWFPLHPVYDDRIIIVSSTTKEDTHTYIDDNGIDKTHSHYPDVDICAPGYLVMGAISTEKKVYDDYGQVIGCEPNTWPYYGSCIGTSFATPIVAGTAALVLSVNPCLEPYDVKLILKSTTDPIADAASYPNGVGTGRLNAFKAVQLAQTYGEIPPITTNTIWDEEKYVKGDLIIEPGSKLTITSIIRFDPNSKIIVKQGAILELDEAILTNSSGCYNHFWQGIIVEGSVQPGNDLSHQGYVELKNGTVIENAECGIYVVANGLVKAIANAFDDDNHPSCRFINNKKALMFETTGYEYTPYKNLSSFSNCEFITNENWSYPSLYPESLVDINRTTGISFEGCKFQNSQPANVQVANRGKRILCTEGGEFSVTSRCIGMMYPCIQRDRNLFEGLFYGIEVLNDYCGVSKITIKDAVFYNNHRGILLEGQYLIADVLLNDFIIGPLATGDLPVPGDPHCPPEDIDWPYCWDLYETISYCVYLNGCTGYKVQENKFYNNSSTKYQIPGLIIKSSGDVPNEVYKNQFDGMSVSCITTGQNSELVADDDMGLKYKCNHFKDNKYALAVIEGTIAMRQREYDGDLDISIPVGNIFDHLYDPVIVGYNSEFYVGNRPWPIGQYYSYEYEYYYYPNNDETQPKVEYTFPVYVHLFPGDISDFVINEACPSLIVKPPLPITAISNNLLAQNTAIAAFDSVLNNSIDGGHTDLLLERIVTVKPKNYSALCQDLIGIAPYASGKVLVEFMKITFKGQPNKKRVVLLANSPLPRVAKAELPNTWLPPPFMQQVVQQQTGVSVVDESYAKLADMKADRLILLQEAIGVCLNNDTVPAYSDSLITLLNNENDYRAKMLLISYFNRLGMYSEAAQALNELQPLIINLNEYKKSQILQYITLQEILEQIRQNPEQLVTIVNNNLTFLEQVADSENPYAYIGAQLLLEQAGIGNYPERIILPFEPAISKDLSIEGTVVENAGCGGMPVEGYKIALIDEAIVVVPSVTPAVTGTDGSFKYSYFETSKLDPAALYSFATIDGFQLQPPVFKTLAEWMADENIILTLSNVNRVWLSKYSVADSINSQGQVIDLNGNLFVTGYILSPGTSFDYITLKYNTNGLLQWVQTYNGIGNSMDIAYTIYADTLSNVYVSGLSYNMQNQTSEYVTIKYDSNGAELWQSKYYGIFAPVMAVDNAGNTYICGMKQTPQATGFFLLKYNINGNLLWVQNPAPPINTGQIINAISLDNENNIIIGGYNSNISDGNSSYYIAKFNANGILLWERTNFYEYGVFVSDITADNNNNIFGAGRKGIIKYDSNGAMQWIQPDLNLKKVAVDNNYDVIAIGEYGLYKYDNITGAKLWEVPNELWDMEIDNSGNIYVLPDSYLLQKYSNNGELIWTVPYSDPGYYSFSDIVISSNNNIYGTGSQSQWYANNLTYELLAVKYAQCPATAGLKNLFFAGEEEPGTEPIKKPVQEVTSYAMLFPNPNNGNMQLDYYFQSKQDGMLVIQNMQGTVVAYYPLNANNHHTIINNDILDNGVYLFRIFEGQEIISQGKLVVIK
ncbi:MAG: S8 family serine peptidase [Bacteroidia bacterium]|nr:S8 family serine peptidase [Bacteroidia bacterium]